MRFIPFEIEIDLWKKHNTLRIAFIMFETPNNSYSLFEIGWYQGEFIFDLLFFNFWRN